MATIFYREEAKKMPKFNTLIINTIDNEIEVFVKDTDFRFRKDQNFDSDYIVTCNRKHTKAYLLQRISANEFKVDQTYTWGVGLWSIATFIDGYTDIYWHNDAFYDKYHIILFKLPYMIAEHLKFRYPNYKDNDLILTHLREDIYFSVDAGQNIFLLSESKKILFLPLTYRFNNPTFSRSWCDSIFLDNIVLENFEVTEELVQKLRKLESIQEMGEVLKKEMLLTTL